MVCLCLIVLSCLSAFAQSQPNEQIAPGTIAGKVVDASGAVLAGAKVKLTGEGKAAGREVASGDGGEFVFADAAPGPFQISITADGFEPQVASGVLHSGENYVVPAITMAVATAMTEVKVALTAPEIAEAQVKDQEKQRVLGVIPNFYISYVPDAPALTSKQKFSLALKTITDPVSFGIVGVIAGVQQAQNDFSGYGQGAQGYAKRYGASLADFTSGTLIGSAILPTILKQDPRYFYKGTGSKRSRMFYALANSVVCKGDNRRWQPNYSSIGGNLAAGGLSNLYYPASDRQGVRLTFESALIGIGATGAANVIQEFFITKITTNVPKHDAPKP